MLVCLLGMAPAIQAMNVERCGFSFDVGTEDAIEINASKWCHVFRLENTSSLAGDYCNCAVTKEGKYYISSPDGTQEYIVEPKGLTRVINPKLTYDDVSWASPYEPLGKYALKYVYGYDDNGNVFVVIYGK